MVMTVVGPALLDDDSGGFGGGGDCDRPFD
jgi:hypothetical protein